MLGSRAIGNIVRRLDSVVERRGPVLTLDIARQLTRGPGSPQAMPGFIPTGASREDVGSFDVHDGGRDGTGGAQALQARAGTRQRIGRRCDRGACRHDRGAQGLEQVRARGSAGIEDHAVADESGDGVVACRAHLDQSALLLSKHLGHRRHVRLDRQGHVDGGDHRVEVIAGIQAQPAHEADQTGGLLADDRRMLIVSSAHLTDALPRLHPQLLDHAHIEQERVVHHEFTQPRIHVLDPLSEPHHRATCLGCQLDRIPETRQLLVGQSRPLRLDLREH